MSTKRSREPMYVSSESLSIDSIFDRPLKSHLHRWRTRNFDACRIWFVEDETKKQLPSTIWTNPSDNLSIYRYFQKTSSIFDLNHDHCTLGGTTYPMKLIDKVVSRLHLYLFIYSSKILIKLNYKHTSKLLFNIIIVLSIISI